MRATMLAARNFENSDEACGLRCLECRGCGGGLNLAFHQGCPNRHCWIVAPECFSADPNLGGFCLRPRARRNIRNTAECGCYTCHMVPALRSDYSQKKTARRNRRA